MAALAAGVGALAVGAAAVDDTRRQREKERKRAQTRKKKQQQRQQQQQQRQHQKQQDQTTSSSEQQQQQQQQRQQQQQQQQQPPEPSVCDRATFTWPAENRHPTSDMESTGIVLGVLPPDTQRGGSSGSSSGGGGGSGRGSGGGGGDEGGGTTLAEAWKQWRAALATDRAHERQRWTSLRLDFGPGDYEGVWDLEDALDVLDPDDPADAPALIEVPRYLANQRRRRLRERMQDPQVRQDFETSRRRRRSRMQWEKRLRRAQRELFVGLAAEFERRQGGEEEAYFDFVDATNPAASGISDQEYNNLVGGPGMAEAWEQLSPAERGVHYRAVGGIGPPLPLAWLHVPCAFMSDEHHEVFSVLRARRRRPARGEHCFDLHLPRAYRFGGAGRWRRAYDLYQRWAMGGSGTTALGLRHEETDELNELLRHVLRPAVAVFHGDGPADAFDVRASVPRQ